MTRMVIASDTFFIGWSPSVAEDHYHSFPIQGVTREAHP
jgi:hypothetical protein